MAEKRPRYSAPTIERYAPFFAGSPAKLPGLVQGVEMDGAENGRSAADLTVPEWDRPAPPRRPKRPPKT